MKKRISMAVLWLAWLAPASQAAVDPDLPSPAPTVTGIFPHGVERGASTLVEISGQNLYDTRSVEFAGRGLQAEILSSLGNKLTVRVTASKAAEAGRRDFRLTTARGVYVGVFDVGALPEIREIENNDDWRKPQPISLPVLVNGVVGNEDWDHFRFHADARETIIFDVSATRHGSRLDADIAILDGHGTEMAWVDDTTIFGDPHLEYTFAKAGDYVVRVGSLASGPNADYRLSAGRLPYVARAFPAGLQSGQTTLMTLSGTHLELVDEVWLGDSLAKADIVQREPNRAQVKFRLPKDVPTGNYRIHASYHGLEVAIPTELRVSNLPEITVTKPEFGRNSALVIQPSVVLNGVITKPASSHYFRFEAKAGERYLFHAESMKLGYHLDPTINLLDSDGKSLAYEDDPGMDERTDEYQLDPDLSYSFKKSGTYYVAIRDAMYRGGDQLLYRLTVKRMEPDFLVELREPGKSFYEGQDGTLLVRIRRRAGWTAPVEVWAEGLPDGIGVERQTAQPKDSIVKDTCGVDRTIDGSLVLLPVHVKTQQPGHFDFTIRARGSMDGVVVEHTATVDYQRLAAGYVYGPMEVQKAELVVSSAPRVILDPPDTVAFSRGGSRNMKVAVRRFGDSKNSILRVQARSTPAGVTADQVEAAAGTTTVSVKIAAGPNATSGLVILEAVDASGKTLGESAPFLVELKMEPEIRK